MNDLFSRKRASVGAIGAPRGVLALAGAVLAIASLRWPWHVALATALGQGAVDPTIVAFSATFLLGAAGIPGFVAALLTPRGPVAAGRRVWMRGSLLLLLTGSLASIGWIATSVHAIGPTLNGRRIALELAAPLAVAALCVWRRRSV